MEKKKIKVLNDSYLTQTEKVHIKHLISKNILNQEVTINKRKRYIIKKIKGNKYYVKIFHSIDITGKPFYLSYQIKLI